MDPKALVARVRDHYVEQFLTFVERQRAGCTQGGSEVKVRLSEESRIFDRLYCIDFVNNDDGSQAIEFQSDQILTFEPIVGTFGGASLSLIHLQWDDVLICHDLDAIPSDDVSRWFQHWFDLEEARLDPDAALCGIIHSLLIDPRCISIDFGSADPDAFWDILELLESAGASQIEVSSSEAQTPTEHQ